MADEERDKHPTDEPARPAEPAPLGWPTRATSPGTAGASAPIGWPDPRPTPPTPPDEPAEPADTEPAEADTEPAEAAVAEPEPADTEPAEAAEAAEEAEPAEPAEAPAEAAEQAETDTEPAPAEADTEPAEAAEEAEPEPADADTEAEVAVPAARAAGPTRGRRRRRRKRRRTVVVAVASVLTVALLAAVGAFVFGPDSVRALVVAPASPTPTVPRPTPTVAEPALGTPATTAQPDADAVAERLRPLLDDKALGTRFGAYVVDPASGDTLLSRRGTSPVTPASTTKIATSVAALHALGPDARLTTSVVRDGDTLVLVGGGDPTLLGPSKQPKRNPYPEFAKLTTLAAETAKQLGDDGTVEVRVDDSLYSGPRVGPGWKPNYVADGNVAPVSALMVDHGKRNPRDPARSRVADPALDAGRQFAQLLEKMGVKVAGKVTRARAADDATQLADVQSPTIAELVEETMTYSDNDLAEALARQVALAEGEPASFAGAADAVDAVLTGLGVGDGIALQDGSGLSTKNRVTPAGLTRLLRLVASGERPELSAVLSGMPVGGFSGTLTDRFAASGATGGVGSVRAKTGSLDGVSSLAGYVQDKDGHVLVFAFVANGIPDRLAWQTHPALDRLAAALAGCGCHKK